MDPNRILSNPALKSSKEIELNEEWNNFIKRVGEVTNLVRDLASGDKEKADAASVLADQYLNGKIITEDNVEMKVKEDRTVINRKAFDNLGKNESVS